ncbi:hypothetical protein PINS_up011805 [Pythium insidiosum]|nr:hypothetical protein PINS_up011805 [Pythium insidiosum]
MCWDPTRRLLDLSTDISICMIEMLWSVLNVAWLSATASSHALSLVDLVLLLVVLAAVETLDAAVIIGTFSRRAFIVDGATALGTAISIVKSALFPAASTAGTTPSPDAASSGRPRRPTIDCQSRESFSVSSPDRALPSSRRALRIDSGCRGSPRSLQAAARTGTNPGGRRRDRRRSSSAQHFLRCANSVFLPAADYEEKGTTMRRLLDLSRYTIAAVTHDAPSSPSPSPSQAQTQVSSHEPGTARRVMLDGITIPRREQARVLEQTLQLLFVIEALRGQHVPAGTRAGGSRYVCHRSSFSGPVWTVSCDERREDPFVS